MKPVIHPVSGILKRLSIGDFLDLFDESVRGDIVAAKGRYPDAEAIVCCENLQMDSSRCGDRSALVVGPSNSWTLDFLMDPANWFRLGDMPSQFQYPVAFVDYRKPEPVEELVEKFGGRLEEPERGALAHAAVERGTVFCPRCDYPNDFSHGCCQGCGHEFDFDTDKEAQ
jgi:hypothetical protein